MLVLASTYALSVSMGYIVVAFNTSVMTVQSGIVAYALTTAGLMIFGGKIGSK